MLRVAIIVAALALVGCGEPPAPPVGSPAGSPGEPTATGVGEAAPGSEEGKPEGPPLPPEIQVEGGPLYLMDKETPAYEMTVNGGSGYRVVSRLVKPALRRIVLINPDGTEQELFRPDWHTLGQAAVARGGRMLVCVNRLTGYPTRITEGDLPDPRTGHDIFCRHRAATGEPWSEEHLVPRSTTALWLASVLATTDGRFNVTYVLDHVGILFTKPEPDEGYYRVWFDGASFSTAVMVLRPHTVVGEP